MIKTLNLIEFLLMFVCLAENQIHVDEDDDWDSALKEVSEVFPGVNVLEDDDLARVIDEE